MPLSPEQTKAVEAVLKAVDNPEFPSELAEALLESNGWDVEKTCAYVRDTPINEIIKRDMQSRFDFSASLCNDVLQGAGGKPFEAWRIANPSAQQSREDRGFSRHMERLVEMFKGISRPTLEHALDEAGCDLNVAIDRCLDASSSALKIVDARKRGVSHGRPDYLVQEFVVLYEKAEKTRQGIGRVSIRASKTRAIANGKKVVLHQMEEDKERLEKTGQKPIQVRVITDKEEADKAARLAIEAAQKYAERKNQRADAEAEEKAAADIERKKKEAEEAARKKAEEEKRAEEKREAGRKKAEEERKKREEARKKAQEEKKKKVEEEAAAKKKKEEEEAAAAAAKKKAEEEEAAKKKAEEEEAAKKKEEEEKKPEEPVEPIVFATQRDNTSDVDHDAICGFEVVSPEKGEREEGASDYDHISEDDKVLEIVETPKKEEEEKPAEEEEEEKEEKKEEKKEEEPVDDITGPGCRVDIHAVVIAIKDQEVVAKKADEEAEEAEKEEAEMKEEVGNADRLRELTAAHEREGESRSRLPPGWKLEVTGEDLSCKELKPHYTVHVEWEMDSNVFPQPSDWIGIFLYNREFTNKYEKYQFTGGVNAGSLDFVLDYPGCYDVRFFRQRKDGFFSRTQDEEVGRTGPVYVGPEMPLTVENKVTTALVTWDKDLVSDPSDWLAVFPVGQHSNRIFCLDRYYKVKDHKEEGCVEVELPREPGKYEVRYFYSKSHGLGMRTPSYPFSGRSEVIEVVSRDFVSVVSHGPKVYVDWGIFSEQYSSWNYVGLYEDSDLDSKSIAFAYISKGQFNPPEEGKKQLYDSGRVALDMSRVAAFKEMIKQVNEDMAKKKKAAKEAGEKFEPQEVFFTPQEMPEVCKTWQVRIYTPNSGKIPLCVCPFLKSSE